MTATAPEAAMPLVTRRAALASLAAAPLARAAAQPAPPWPDRPVHWMVGYGPGGASDVYARLLGRAVTATSGQSVLVENRPSGGAIVATEYVIHAAPDGATVLHVDNGVMIYNPALYARLPFDPDRDLTMAAFLGRFPFLLLVRADAPWPDFAAWRAATAARPLSFGTPAVASPHQLAMEVLKRRAGFEATHVPYRGMPAVVSDLLAGTLDSAIIETTNALPILRAGRARALLTFGADRALALPDVPTAMQLGIPGVDAYGWMGVAVPSATPAPLVARINAAIRAALDTPEVAAQMTGAGVERLPLDPAACAALVARESAAWRPLIRDLGIRLDA